LTGPPAGRLVALLVALLFAFGGIFARLAVLQVADQSSLVKLGYDQRVHTIVLPAQRGEITDRTGAPLALSIDARDIYADPQLVTDPLGEAAKIAPLLGLRPTAVRAALSGTGSFAYVARQVDVGVAKQLEAMHLAGLGFIPVPKRTYPAGPLASQVLGFVGVDGTGLAGLENQYNAVLAGTPGERTREVGANGAPITQGVDLLKAPVAGRDLVTTLDRQLQYQAEAALEGAVKSNHAKGGTIIVMDPHTGDILAMASYPTYDPNMFETAKQEAMRNRAVTDAFEPGSVNKTITASVAVQEHTVSVDQRFTVPWTLRVGPFTIHDSHPHGLEQMTLGDIVAQSSNIGAVEVARTIGSNLMASYLARFGFGQPTGLGFPGETAGVVPGLASWTNATLATVAYGQGLTVSPLQMASVYATIANRGTWVQPRLVKGTVDGNGTFLAAPASPTRSVVSPATASTVTQMLSMVVQDGTGLAAQIPGYQVAGKTGTALVADPNGGYYRNRYVASFIGFLPASDPQVVVAAVIDEPSTIYGGVAAAPLFQHVAQYAIQRLGIAPGHDVPLPPSAILHR
jgi:cell division protein FtsI (penicillin-binding protein 3)